MLEISKPFDEFKVRLPDEWTKHVSKSMWHWSNGRNGHGRLCHLSKTNVMNQEASKEYLNSVIFIYTISNHSKVGFNNELFFVD